jgi:uncharacterized cupin superfamily protein
LAGLELIGALREGAAMRQAAGVVPEAHLEPTEHGLVPTGGGWYVLGAREARWRYGKTRGAYCDFEGGADFGQIGVNVQVLDPGDAMGMYHWEADQEDFLVLAGEALLVVEGEERPLRRWDFVHCPPGTNHIIVGAGDGPCVVLAVGAREHADSPGWGGYTAHEAALRHDAGVESDTTDELEAYPPERRREYASYREGWLPD